MPPRFSITLCDGPSCMHKRSKEIISTITKELDKHGLTEKVGINLSGCLGMCGKGPVMIINPGYVIYGSFEEKDIPEIITQHLLKKKPVTRFIIDEDHLYNRFFRVFGDVNFFGKQMRIALRNCGIIDPESIDDYISLRGYEALAKSDRHDSSGCDIGDKEVGPSRPRRRRVSDGSEMELTPRK